MMGISREPSWRERVCFDDAPGTALGGGGRRLRPQRAIKRRQRRASVRHRVGRVQARHFQRRVLREELAHEQHSFGAQHHHGDGLLHRPHGAVQVRVRLDVPGQQAAVQRVEGEAAHHLGSEVTVQGEK